ncbi:rRNA 2'-O-methyltransferase fibrillarin 2 [Linum perenne]
MSNGMLRPILRMDFMPVYILFECALGYALFYFHNIDQDGYNFESAIKHIQDYNHIEHYKHIFKLIAYYPFQSTAAALSQLTDLYNSNPTKELVDFLVHNLPKPNTVGKFSISSSDGNLIHNLLFKRKIRVPAARAGMDTDNILRGLRTIICELILKKPAGMEKFQRDVAFSFSKQMCKSTNKGNSMAANSSSSSFFDDEVVVVPHKFEGVFIAKGKNNDAVCTKNLVPGEAVNGEQLISVKNKDGIETEYKIWNLSRSKLAAAIQCGVENIWVKPGSRVLYMGDICGTTVSHLSDLAGPVCGLVTNTLHYLKTGGHFLYSTKASDVFTNSENEIAFEGMARGEQWEYKVHEIIGLEQLYKDHVMAVGCFRPLDSNA